MEKKIQNPKFSESYGSEFSWGPTKTTFEETKDYATAKWASEELSKPRKQPFFLAVGLSKPHLPWYVPQEFFDLYDLDTLKIADINLKDFQDIYDNKNKVAFEPHVDYLWTKEYNQIKEATQAYLANVSYADACLGIIFKALKNSPAYQNTIVVIWGDHGWHLGEKLRYRKGSLWLESVKNPLIIRAPDMKSQKNCHQPVNLIDLYPTLIELCGLEKQTLDGHDISSLLKTPNMKWEKPAITVAKETQFSILQPPWHYIHRENDVCELYQIENDPLEWNNLYRDKEYSEIIKRMKKHLPETSVKQLQASKQKTKFTDLAQKSSFNKLRKWTQN